jgi:hypothetical protein
MPACFSPRIAAVFALSGCLLAARAAHAQSAPPAPQQPYAPYAAAPPYPAPAWAAPVEVERNSPAMVASGIALISLGTVGSFVGAALLAAGTETSYVPCPPAAFDCNSARKKPGLTAAGATLVALSTASLIVGIPVFAVGMRKVPITTGPRALVPELRVGAGGGALRWQF